VVVVAGSFAVMTLHYKGSIGVAVALGGSLCILHCFSTCITFSLFGSVVVIVVGSVAVLVGIEAVLVVLIN
jgi:hypothetical protein